MILSRSRFLTNDETRRKNNYNKMMGMVLGFLELKTTTIKFVGPRNKPKSRWATMETRARGNKTF
jgi:hypothetical protein